MTSIFSDVLESVKCNTNDKNALVVSNLVDQDMTFNILRVLFKNIQFEDIPSSPGETHSYFEDEEYSTFLMRFIWAFEEAVGLDKYRPGLTA